MLEVRAILAKIFRVLECTSQMFLWNAGSRNDRMMSIKSAFAQTLDVATCTRALRIAFVDMCVLVEAFELTEMAKPLVRATQKSRSQFLPVGCSSFKLKWHEATSLVIEITLTLHQSEISCPTGAPSQSPNILEWVNSKCYLRGLLIYRV